MNQAACIRARQELHAYRAGELAPLARQWIDQHLDHCAECRDELAYQSELEEAARLWPRPLDHVRRQSILDGVHAAVGLDQERTDIRIMRRRLMARRAAVAGIAALTAAAAASLIFLATQPDTTWHPIPASRAVTALAREPGAVAFSNHNEVPKMALGSGQVMVSFTRRRALGPLRISTQHATVVVRGTALYVATTPAQTLVVVDHGLVEVINSSGESRLVAGGQQVVATAAGAFTLSLAAGDVLASLEEHLPRSASAEDDRGLTIDAGSPSTEGHSLLTPEGRQRPAKSRFKKGSSPAKRRASARAAAMASLRQLWEQGDRREALVSLDTLRHEAGLDTPALDEALHLLGAVERSLTRWQGALEFLEHTTRRPQLSDSQPAFEEELRRLQDELEELMSAQRILAELIIAPPPQPLPASDALERCRIMQHWGANELAERCRETWQRGHAAPSAPSPRKSEVD